MTVLAICCHPDDMEMMMGGTVLLLKQAGCAVHTINVANGCAGSVDLRPSEIAAVRKREAEASAKLLGSFHHESLTDDLEVFYTQDLIRRVTALVRQVKPNLVLTQSLEDYMDDHMNTAKVAVTATFSRNIPGFRSTPDEPATFQDAMLYHATPHILTDMMRRPITPEIFVDVSTVMAQREKLLACHASQKDWLDKTQGFDSYLTLMKSLAEKVGGMSGRFKFAEGWRRHSHVGFTREDCNPLADMLKDRCLTVPRP